MDKDLNILSLCPKREAKAAQKIAEIVKSAGGTAMLVGGCVRDAMLGVGSSDLDIEIYGVELDKLIRLLSTQFKLNLVGSSFGVIKISGVDIDVALPRLENKVGQGHRGFIVKSDIELDYATASARRDFTINAMMFNILTKELIDPHNGAKDLANRELRPVSSHFAEDPLRVLRAMQFLARFNLTATKELIEVCQTMTPEGLAVERLGEEWKKLLLKGETPSIGLAFLKQCGWLKYYAELSCLDGCPQYKEWHPEGDVWQHTLHCVDAGAKLRSGNSSDNLIFMLAVLCHDLGKPATTVHEPDGRITSKNHEDMGEKPTMRFLASLFRDKDLPNQVIPLVLNHLKPYTFFYQQASDRAFRRLMTKVSRPDLLVKVAQADSAGRPPMVVDLPPLEWFKERVEALALLDGAPKPLIQGRDVLALNVPAGRLVGELVKACYEEQLDGGVSTYEEGIKYLENLIKVRGL